jgi:hypothetical protein
VQEASYEPELHAGVIYKVEDLGATITIHQTGQMIIFAPSVKNLKEAVEYVYPLVEPYQHVSSVLEFQRWWVLKSKVFGQESTCHQGKIFKKIL